MSVDPFAPVAELSRRIAARELSPVELTEAYLARIEAVNPKINAFLTVTADVARAEAKAAADEIATKGPRGPLHGIPYGLKDLVDTAGIKTTWGARPYADRVPASDAPLVTRLRAAGAVLLGKLHMTELANAFGSRWADAAIGGACRTPWDTTRWAGGSSSGPGAAVAAGLVGFAIGSETWGSIDCPSAFCGVTGLRPTYDLVSRKGTMTVAWTLDKLGPLCRAAGDCALVLDVIREDGKTTGAKPLPRVGFLPVDEAYDAETTAVYDAARKTLADAGITLEAVTLPTFPAVESAVIVIGAEAEVAFEELIRSGGVDKLSDRVPWADKRKEDDLGTRASDYVKAMRVRAAVQRAYQELLAAHPVIISPGRNGVAPPVDTKLGFKPSKSFRDLLTCGNLAGLPGITVPAGFVGGLPVSVHMCAGPYDEASLVAVASAFQAKSDWHSRHPKL